MEIIKIKGFYCNYLVNFYLYFLNGFGISVNICLISF